MFFYVKGPTRDHSYGIAHAKVKFFFATENEIYAIPSLGFYKLHVLYNVCFLQYEPQNLFHIFGEKNNWMHPYSTNTDN